MSETKHEEPRTMADLQKIPDDEWPRGGFVPAIVAKRIEVDLDRVEREFAEYRNATIRAAIHHADDAALALIRRLRDGMREWASDEDGVHYRAWDAYADACEVLGEPRPAEDPDHA